MTTHATPHAIGTREDRLSATARGLGDWLCLAATPTFATMALLTALPTGLSGGPQDMPCAAMPAGSPLTGMGCMYLLMSAFHAAPWLRLLAGRRRAA